MRTLRLPGALACLMLLSWLPAAPPGPAFAAPNPAGVPPTPAAPGTAAPASPGASNGTFAQPDRTIEYHFMIQVAPMTEAALADSFQARVVEPLKVVADVGPLGRCHRGAYVDSREHGLEAHDLIVRVRDGQITVKARASSPTALLDLQGCTSKKYETDQFDRPEYSISSDIKVRRREFNVPDPTSNLAGLWALMESRCPGMWRQVRPVVAGSPGLQIPGVAHMYSADAALKLPGAAGLKEAGVAVWFFPPTAKFLVELSFTGYVKDRLDQEKMCAEIGSRLKAAGLLKADQSSKTRQYFGAYFGASK
jgi:hypothetical protein